MYFYYRRIRNVKKQLFDVDRYLTKNMRVRMMTKELFEWTIHYYMNKIISVS